ncbi:MAG: ATP synthase F1 subunit delta [Chitinophagales bacterium]
MSSFRVAQRYAKSLIMLAQEKGKLAEINKDFRRVDEIFETSKDLKAVFKSPIIAADKKLAIAKKVFEGNTSEMVYSFIVLLIKKGREADLHEIAEAFITQYNVIAGITPVKFTSAVKLDAAEVNRIISNLKAKENLKEVELTEEVDPELIGGFVLTYGDKMVDASVKNQLHGFRKIVDDNSYIKKY